MPVTDRAALLAVAERLTRDLGRFAPDGERPCEQTCGLCAYCVRATRQQLGMLTQRGTRTWGYWKGPELQVLVYFTDIVPRTEAQFHGYVADGRLLAHSQLLRHALTLPGVRRVYASVPDFRAGLVPYLTRRLGFHFLPRQCRVCRWRGALHQVTVLERRF